MSEVTLRIFPAPFNCDCWTWALVDNRIYVTSSTENGYAKKANAKRGAENAAKRLGLKITRTETEK